MIIEYLNDGYSVEYYDESELSRLIDEVIEGWFSSQN